jgi:hypothetical protein
MKYPFLAFWACLISISGMGQLRKTDLLPKGHLFEPILLDPIEAQSYAAFGRGLNHSFINAGLYVPFAVGFQKGIVRWQNTRNKAREVSLDVAAFTQFEIFYSHPDQKVRRHMLNSDYKVSLNYQGQVNEEQSFRLRFFHISSHLGDDYLLKNNYTSFFRNPVNYEQADFTYAWQKTHWRYYGGVGLGIRPRFTAGQERKRLAFQGGVLFKKPVRGKQNVKWVAGADVRLLQQTDFVPGIKVGFGAQVGDESRNPISFLFEYYAGHLPYSKFEDQYVHWLAAGFYFNPF